MKSFLDTDPLSVISMFLRLQHHSTTIQFLRACSEGRPHASLTISDLNQWFIYALRVCLSYHFVFLIYFVDPKVFVLP